MTTENENAPAPESGTRGDRLNRARAFLSRVTGYSLRQSRSAGRGVNGMFSGRLGRRHLLFGVLLATGLFGIPSAVLFIVGFFVGFSVLVSPFTSPLWLLLILIPAFVLGALHVLVAVSMTVRRLHDFGQTGIWSLAFIAVFAIPVVGPSLFTLGYLGLALVEANPNANRYGQSRAGAKFNIFNAWFGRATAS